jgi:hypothetical protein
MVQETFCDADACRGKRVPAYEKVKVCYSYTDYTESSFEGRKEYKPFEKCQVYEQDLCEDHYRLFCEATYKVFHVKTIANQQTKKEQL